MGTRSQPGSALEVSPEVDTEAGGTGGTPLTVTQEDCLVLNDVSTLKLPESLTKKSTVTLA